jgi:hypothetical protein
MLFNPFQQMTLSMGLNTPNLFQASPLASNPFGTVKFTSMQQQPTGGIGGAGNPFATTNAFNPHASVNFGTSTFGAPIAPHSPLASPQPGSNPFATTASFNPHSSVNFSAQAQNPFATNVLQANPSPFAGLSASPPSSASSFASPGFGGGGANPFASVSTPPVQSNPFATVTAQPVPLSSNPFATNVLASPQASPFGSPAPSQGAINPFAQPAQPVSSNPFATTTGY